MATARRVSRTKWGGADLSREEIHERKKRSLVAAAGRVFRKKGFQDASMEDISSELNVSKTAIYYYVKNKSELLYLCHSLAFDLGEDALRNAQRLGGTGRDKLSILLRDYVISLTSELGGGALMTSDSMLEPQHLADIRDRRTQWDQAFREIAEQGIADGSIRHCDVRLVEFFIMGAIRSLHRWYSSDGPKTGEEIADELLSLVFHGIGMTSE